MSAPGLPHDDDTEAILLGSLLMGGDAGTVRDILQPAHLHAPRHQTILAAILDADEAGERTTAAAIGRRLKDGGRLKDAGGHAYLTSLAQRADARGTERPHAEALGRVYRRRVAVLAARALEERIQADPNAEPAALLATLQADLETERPTSRGWVPQGELVAAAVQRIEERMRHPDEVPGIPTGIADLDRKIGGLQRGRSYLVAGRPAMGKSALAQGFAEHAAGHGGVAVGIITLEMPGDEVAERAIAQEARVNNGDLRNGTLTADQWRRVMSASDRLAALPVYVDDSPAATIAQIVAKVRRLRARVPELGLIVLDYLQLATADGGRNQNRQQEIGKISRGMKELAKELDIACVSLAQLNRGCEARTDKRPLPSDLREAGDLEQDADGILFVYRDEVYNKASADKGIAEIIVAKMRAGSTGTVRCAWVGAEYRFADLAVTAPPPTYHDREPDEGGYW